MLVALATGCADTVVSTGTVRPADTAAPSESGPVEGSGPPTTGLTTTTTSTTVPPTTTSTSTTSTSTTSTTTTTVPPVSMDCAEGLAFGESMFPRCRVVALYGNDSTSVLGVLGEQPPAEAVDRLQAVVEGWRNSDRPIQGAFELIATIATAAPGASGNYRSRSSPERVQRYLDVVDEAGLILILDIQPGRSDFLSEVRHYEEFLRLPNVHVALDPEWRVRDDQAPGGGLVGQVDAWEVNAVAEYLAAIVAEEELPDKLLVVHQFQIRMITDKASLVEPEGITLTIHMDGFGTRDQKLETYRLVHVDEPWNNGFKLFYDEDIDMYQPDEVLSLVDPVPDLVTYQ